MYRQETGASVYQDIKQGSEAWRKMRLGKLTASRVKDALKVKKDGTDYAERSALRLELVAERLTGFAIDKYVNQAMQWGTEMEPQARAAFEAQTGIIVDVPGFIDHPRIEWCGCSPDGFVGSDALLEIKCPSTTTHLKWMLEGEVPAEHIPQMTLQMACTGRPMCFFVSFDPRLPKRHQLFIREFKQAAFGEFEVSCIEFLKTVDEAMERINGN